MDAGLLKVHRCDGPTHWHASIAKNTVHLRATEDIVVNLDADNIAGPGFVLDVLQRFGRARLAACHYRVEGVAGTVGRIACRRRDFLYLQGYDEEDVHPAGAQDIDLWLRLSMLAKSQEQIVEKVNDGTKAMAIRNSLEEKTQFTNSHLSWKQMNQENWDLFEARRATSTTLRRNTKTRQLGLRSRELRFVQRTWLGRGRSCRCAVLLACCSISKGGHHRQEPPRLRIPADGRPKLRAKLLRWPTDLVVSRAETIEILLASYGKRRRCNLVVTPAASMDSRRVARRKQSTPGKSMVGAVPPPRDGAARNGPVSREKKCREGKKDQVDVYRFTGQLIPRRDRERKGLQASLLSWEEWPAKEELLASLDLQLQNRGGLVLVHGGPGSGKTELAAHVRAWAMEHDLTVLSGQNQSPTGTITVPRLCWQEVFSALLKEARSDPFWNPREGANDREILRRLLSSAGATREVMAWLPVLRLIIPGLYFGPNVANSMVERDVLHALTRPSRVVTLCKMLIDAFSRYSTKSEGTVILLLAVGVMVLTGLVLLWSNGA
ncbi:unnamed protein product [Cladocopium goreaui]|uniref:3-hydroxyisobutyryl-CoA hydrolase n=1 Tax=Cladocopium goreaui TaxID=2562237 RepID=A0A9P1FJD9_9DINO|nr:unnamed protein product [Cladocopium goreaui]